MKLSTTTKSLLITVTATVAGGLLLDYIRRRQS